MSVPSYPRHLTDWVARGLEALLGFSDDQMVAHLLSFSKKQALSEHTQDFLGANRAVEEFTSELWRRKTGEKDTTGPSAAQRVTGGGGSAAQQAERKQPESSPAKPQQREADLYGSATNTSSAAIKQKAQQQQQIDALGLGKNVRVKHQAAKRGGGGGDPLQPAGRAPCHCQATTHALFTNCTACGKIVCEQEGEGPCFFCGSMVTAAGTFPNDDFVAWMESMESKDLVQRQEENAAKRGAKKGEPAEASSSSTPAMEAAARESEAAGLAKAETQRDKLLQYATEKKGSKIYDDQNDWYEFESNRWLTQEARDAKKKETEQQLLNLERRKAHTLTLDIENKQIITHSSDAWKESLQPEPAGKWTDARSGSRVCIRVCLLAVAQSFGFSLLFLFVC
jgi:hypothetical protein